MENGSIVIRVLDKRTFKNSVIGVYHFSVSNIYFREDHCLQHQWIALSNPESQSFNEITGYLKVSISVIGENDDQVKLSDEDGSDSDHRMIIVPPHISINYY